MQSKKIISVKRCGIGQTYDLEVKSKDHLFYANGILTSNSHSVEYATVSYYTSYAKSHFPAHFITSWLYYAKEKQKPLEEISEIVLDSKNMGIDIYPPKLENIFYGDIGEFAMNPVGILFGLSSVKGIGESHVKKLLLAVEDVEKQRGKKIRDITWLEFLCFIADKTNSTVVKNFISVGGLDIFGIDRRRLLFEYNIWSNLTPGEIRHIIANVDKNQNFEESLKRTVAEGYINGRKIIAKRHEILKKWSETFNDPAYNLKDNNAWIVNTERELLGISLTTTSVDNTYIQTDTNCKDIIDGKKGKVCLCVEVVKKNETVTKKGKSAGKTMAFLKIADSTGNIDCAVFAETYSKYKDILYDGNTVIIEGFVKDSLTANKISQV